jgi:hypothetical protein
MFLSGGLILVRPSKQAAFLSVFFLSFAYAMPAVAAPLFPCIKAVASKNGNFLVLSDIQGGPGQGSVRRVSLQVFPKETFINAKDKLTAPATYWAGRFLWSLILDADIMHDVQQPCLLPLITDDGEFLILLHTGPASPDGPVLRIYRRRDHPGDPLREGPDHGVFIKNLAIREIWIPDELAAQPNVWTDHSPQWFAGGTFEFSSDSRQLVHRTPGGTTVRIYLPDGSVSKDQTQP